ncbi:hypothetical protein [Streptomyces sp. NPDC051576]|uniref:hypothetical protein n=1 Tax=Streptomyces sp. NPDC051576 TaxID=3155803 RepID=UPI00341AD0E9
MKWRYASPRAGTSQLLEDSVRELPTQVDWTLGTTQKNWILIPSRILDESHGFEDPAFMEAVNQTNVQDQDFCLKALADFRLIIQHLQQIPAPGG